MQEACRGAESDGKGLARECGGRRRLVSGEREALNESLICARISAEDGWCLVRFDSESPSCRNSLFRHRRSWIRNDKHDQLSRRAANTRVKL